MTKNIFRKFFFAIFFLIFLIPNQILYSQVSGPVVFMKERLQNSNYIQCIVSDEEGYVWFGTGNGIYRFNGSSYKAYFHADSESIASNFICSLCPDQDGSIWVGTDLGVTKINKNKSVENFNLDIRHIYAIEHFDDDNLVVSGVDGLYKFNKGNGEISLILLDEELAFSKMLRVTGSHIWGLSSLDSSRIVIVENKHVVKSLQFDKGETVTSIFLYEGKMYVTSNKGIRCYSNSGDELSLPLPLEQYSSSDVLYASPDPFNSSFNLFVKGSGGFRYFTKENKIQKIEGIGNLSSANHFQAVSVKNNIAYTPDGMALEFSHEMNSLFFAVSNLDRTEFVYDVYPSPSSRNVFFTTPRGVYLYNLTTFTTTNITPDMPDTGNSVIINSHYDNNRIWLVLSGGTILKYNIVPKDGRFEFVFDHSFDVGSSDIHLWGTTEGSEEVNFVLGSSVFTIDEDNNITETPTSLKLSNLPCRSYDGKLYLYGKEGVFAQGPDKSFTKLPIDVDPVSMAVDYNGNLWIGTDADGIYVFNVEDNTVKNLTASDGLPENSVRTILSYKDNVWVAFRSNASRISVDTYHVSTILDPVLGMYAINYKRRSGTARFVPMLGDRIIFGNGKGLTCIDPLEGQIERQIPLNIDAIMSNGEAFYAEEGETLTFDYKHNSLVFNFSGIDYDYGRLLRYSYQLDGYDKEWMYSSTNTSATYTSLPAGNYTFKVRVQLPNGQWGDYESTVNVRVKSHPLLSAPMKALYFILALALIALVAYLIEKKRSEKERKQIGEIESKMNSQLDKEKVDFFTNISHEYRTPLALIYGPAKELAEADGMPDNSKKLLNIIKSNASKMLDLTEEILDYDKISSGVTEKLKVKKTNVTSLIESTTNNFGYLFEKRGLSYSCDLDKIDNAYCDSSKILRILTNFISNSIKYTPEGGSVLVAARNIDPSYAKKYGFPELDPDKEYAIISVTDTGIGIPKDKIKKIFEKYERLKSQDSLGIEGFGVGLNYALHLADIHKGYISVSPNTPKGAIFSCVFPISKNAYAEDELLSPLFTESGNYAKVIENSVSEKVIPEQAKDYKVVVVEDNQQLREFVVDVLGKNFTVESFSDGEPALDYLKKNKADIVVSDLMMPNMDGFALCQMVKEQEETANLPFILLTAATEDSTKAEGFSKKADAFLSKPFDPDVLRMQVYSLIENRKNILVNAGNSQPVEKDPFEGMAAKDRAFLEKMISLMEANLSNDSYSAAIMAEDMGFSYSKFFYKSKDLLGIAPSEWISSYRLNKAMELLKAGEHNVSEVAFKTGFSSIQSFSRSFKNKFGFSPSSV